MCIREASPLIGSLAGVALLDMLTGSLAHRFGCLPLPASPTGCLTYDQHSLHTANSQARLPGYGLWLQSNNGGARHIDSCCRKGQACTNNLMGRSMSETLRIIAEEELFVFIGTDDNCQLSVTFEALMNSSGGIALALEHGGYGLKTIQAIYKRLRPPIEGWINLSENEGVRIVSDKKNASSGTPKYGISDGNGQINVSPKALTTFSGKIMKEEWDSHTRNRCFIFTALLGASAVGLWRHFKRSLQHR